MMEILEQEEGDEFKVNLIPIINPVKRAGKYSQESHTLADMQQLLMEYKDLVDVYKEAFEEVMSCFDK